MPILPTSLLLVAPVLGGGEPAAGFRMYSPTGDVETYLLDQDDVIVHTWTSDLGPTAGIYLEPDGTLTRSGNPGNGPGIGGEGGAVQRISFDNDILWDYRYEGPEGILHHDIALMPNGNVLMIAWEIQTDADAIAAGRDPALLGGTDWFPDQIIEVQQTGPTTGAIVWQWNMMDHIVQDFDVTKPNFGNPADHPELLDINFPPTSVDNGDWNHCNSIDYDELSDTIVLSSPFQNEFWIIDHSTTTLEAAGHTGGNFGKGGDFLYRWGNPEAYGAGTTADQKLFFQHTTHFIDEGLPGAGNILIFNNRAGIPAGLNYSSVVEVDIPSDFSLLPGEAYGPTDFEWEYIAPNPEDFYSFIVSSARRMPNGNTLVCSGFQGWIFELDTNDQIVWEHFNQTPTPEAVIFQATHWERHLWASRESISGTDGGSVYFGMVAGSEYAGDNYLVLGSITGTAPGIPFFGATLPLNPDPYFVLTIKEANSSLLPRSFGVLDALGNGPGTAHLELPPGIAAPIAGVVMNHAFLVLDPLTFQVKLASNAAPLEILP